MGHRGDTHKVLSRVTPRAILKLKKLLLRRKVK